MDSTLLAVVKTRNTTNGNLTVSAFVLQATHFLEKK